MRTSPTTTTPAPTTAEAHIAVPAAASAAVPAAGPAHTTQATRATVHREPVVTLDGRVIGYEVTVRVEPVVPTQAAADGARAVHPGVPVDLLHEHYMALDLARLVADRFVFLPATPQMLDGFIPEPVVHGRLVLVLPEGYEHTPQAPERAAALRSLGAQLALVGYRGEPAQEALLPRLGFVVVDAAAGLPMPALVHHVHRSGTRVLATGVHDGVEAECRAAGVDGLLGTHGERGSDPASGAGATGQARVLRAGELQCLALMHALTQPDVDLSAVAQVVDTDPVLTLRVLHLVNSGAFALRNQVDTVHQAVVLLGSRELMTLVAALAVDARPDAMDSLWFILARALTCEALTDDSAAYTVGMISALATQLGVPAAVLVEKVGVSEAVGQAVLTETGPYGPVLAAVRGHERGDVVAVEASGLDHEAVSVAYVRAVADALETARAVTRDAGA